MYTVTVKFIKVVVTLKSFAKVGMAGKYIVAERGLYHNIRPINPGGIGFWVD